MVLVYGFDCFVWVLFFLPQAKLFENVKRTASVIAFHFPFELFLFHPGLIFQAKNICAFVCTQTHAYTCVHTHTEQMDYCGNV